MARRFDVQYISAYTDGSAARKLELPQVQKAARKRATAKRSKRIVLHVDPVAIMGILVAGVMMVLLAVGMFRLLDARNDMTRMDSYLHTLRQENATLQAEYDAGYDIENVRQTALALGMVPVEQVQRIPIQVHVPQQETPSKWDQFCIFLAGLFA